MVTLPANRRLPAGNGRCAPDCTADLYCISFTIIEVQGTVFANLDCTGAMESLIMSTERGLMYGTEAVHDLYKRQN